MRIVFDSSTLILLAKIDMLRDVTLQTKAAIPKKVEQEVLAKKTPDAELARLLIHEGRLEVIQVRKEVVRKLAEDFRLHAGEAEALALAIDLLAPLAVDDGPTIKACKLVGRPFLTAIHFLIHIAGTDRISRAIALEKLNQLSIYGRYKGRIIEDAARRIKGDHQ